MLTASVMRPGRPVDRYRARQRSKDLRDRCAFAFAVVAGACIWATAITTAAIYFGV